MIDRVICTRSSERSVGILAFASILSPMMQITEWGRERTMKKMMRLIAVILMFLSQVMGIAFALEGDSVYDDYLDQGAYYTENEGIVFAVTGKSYIRSLATPESEAIDVLPEHSAATYLGEREYDYRGVEWYKINYEGTSGWVSSRYTYLSIIQIEPYRFCTILRAAESSFIRIAPSTDAKDIDAIPEGATCQYLMKFTADMNGRIWFYVSNNEATGWVSSRYVDFIL